MNEMNQKKLYVWRLATFLHSHGMVMSAAELAEHLNRNNFRTGYDTEFSPLGRGPYNIIRATWHWLNDDLRLEDEARNVALAYVKPDGTHAWDTDDAESEAASA
jgi:hypothetical protein